jgi:hypothetical protein
MERPKPVVKPPRLQLMLPDSGLFKGVLIVSICAQWAWASW